MLVGWKKCAKNVLIESEIRTSFAFIDIISAYPQQNKASNADRKVRGAFVKFNGIIFLQDMTAVVREIEYFK